MIEKGRPWERPAEGPPDVVVDGDDPALAAAVGHRPGARVAFRPDAASDFATGQLDRLMTLFASPPGREHYEVMYADLPGVPA